MTILILLCSVKAHAEDINMDIIADIESSKNPLAYNKESGAVGEYQITDGVIRTFNAEYNPNFEYQLYLMYQPDYAFTVANWFINTKISSWLNYYDIPDTTTSRLIAYNWGIGHLRKWFKRGSHWNQLPKETRNYIKKYYKELKGN